MAASTACLGLLVVGMCVYILLIRNNGLNKKKYKNSDEDLTSSQEPLVSSMTPQDQELRLHRMVIQSRLQDGIDREETGLQNFDNDSMLDFDPNMTARNSGAVTVQVDSVGPMSVENLTDLL